MEGGDDRRESLLDVMQKRIQGPTGQQNTMIHRLVYVARAITVPLRGELLASFHDNSFSRLSREIDPVHGLLLVYPNCALGIVESTSRGIRTLLTALEAVPQGERIVTDIRVLSNIENVPRVLYPTWSWRAYGGMAGDDQGEEQLKTQQAVLDAVQGVSKFGKLLAQGSPAAVLETAKAGGTELLPSSNAVIAFTRSKFTLPLATFTSLYCAPIDIRLEGESVFPARAIIKY
eukprot:tig00000970_g5851.t1